MHPPKHTQIGTVLPRWGAVRVEHMRSRTRISGMSHVKVPRAILCCQECRTSKYPVPSSAVRNVARHSTPCHPLQWRHGHPSADLHTPGPADPAHRTHVQGRKLAAMARSRMRIEDWRSRNEYHSRGAQHIHGSCVYTSILRNSDTTSTPSFIQ